MLAVAQNSILTNAQAGVLLSDIGTPFTKRLGLFGDSMTHNGYYTSGGTAGSGTSWFIPSAADNFARSWGWSTWVAAISKQRLIVEKSWAVQTNGLLVPGTNPAGYSLSQQVTNALADSAWSNVDEAVILIGTNDAGNQTASLVYSTPQQCVTELLRQIARIKKKVTLIASPPYGGTVTTVVGDNLQIWAWLLEWKALLKRVAYESGGTIRFVDGYSIVNSPTTNPDVIASAYTYAPALHYNNAGAYLLASAVVNSILPTGISGDLDIWPHNSSAATAGAVLMDQGFANPLFGTASGGTGTGTIAGSLTVTNIGTATHVGSVATSTISGTKGNMQTIDITSNADGDGVDIVTTSFHTAGGTFLAAGDTCWAQQFLQIVSGGIYPRNLFFRLQGFQNPTNYNALLFELDTAKEVALPFTGTTDLLLRTPTLTMPSGAAFTNLTIKSRITFAGAGTCTIRIAHLEARRFRVGGVYH